MPTAAQRKALKSTENLVRTFQNLPGRQRKEGIASPRPTQYSRDAQRQRVYDAEHDFVRLVRGRAEHPRISISGVSMDVPDILRFGDLAAVQSFVDQVTRHAGASRISVHTNDRLAQRANYSGGVITLPLGGVDHRWAWNQAVLLHEIAHHLAAGARHNSPFPAALTELFTTWISPEAGLLLRLLYLDLGVKL
jgi:putative metallohydrolase (TIGR04338 family)